MLSPTVLVGFHFLTLFSLITGGPESEPGQLDRDKVRLVSDEPLILEVLHMYYKSNLGLLCSLSLSTISTCQKRTICISTGHVFASTCDYYHAICKGVVPADAPHVECKEKFQMVDCRKFEGQDCPVELDPGCGYETKSYFPNKCEACKANTDRLDHFVQLSEHKRCILEKTDDAKLVAWAKMADGG